MISVRLLVRYSYFTPHTSRCVTIPRFSRLSHIPRLLSHRKNHNMSLIKKRYDNIIKSSEDKRDYRGLELANGMKVMLVSDPSTDKSAAALCVNIGFMSDPENLPGLAHFCEHMLFLGTEKYPLENEYPKYLSENGGSSNAHTTHEHTTYYFDVTPEYFKGALDRFAQFFIAPLFTENVADREVNAVNSEHEKNIVNDSWRLNQLERSLSRPGHPYTKFGTGNKATLDTIPKEQGINVRDELLAFHKKWYSANIMTLAVLGKENLDDLEELVVSLFSDVENKNIEAPVWEEGPFSEDELMLKGYVVPIKDVRSLAITFLIPDYRKEYKASPGHYLSHLIGHEGPGSLLSLLKSRSWCNNLIGGPRGSNKGFDFFTVNVDLTPEGIDHVDDIIGLLFQYINMLKEKGPQKWIFEEFSELFNMHFRFKDKQSPRAYVSTLVVKLIDYDMEYCLAGGYKITEWKPDLINELLGHLSPQNLRAAVVAKRFEGIADQTEKWYGTQYKVEKIPKSVIDRWSSKCISEELHLPDKNEFIPTDFELFPREDNPPAYPVMIHETPFSRVWYKQDQNYLLPKVNMSFEFISPLAYLDPVSCNLTYMFVMLFKDTLNEYAYAAELAGLRWDLTNTKYGMVLGIGGYNHKQKVLLEKIMEKMTNFEINPKRFEIIKEMYIRGLKNFATEQPYQHANYYLAILLAEQAWTKSELLAATDAVTIEALDAFIKQLLSRMHVESLVHGNTCREFTKSASTRSTSDAASKILPHNVEVLRLWMQILATSLSQSKRIQLAETVCRCVLFEGANFLYELDNNYHKSSCAETYYQCSLQSTDSNMLLELFVQIISEPCFSILRTKEQLGYIVFSGVRRSNGTQGLRIIVQSDRHPRYIDERVETFLESMGEYIMEMTPENFEKHKESLAAQKLEKPKQMSSQSAIYWAEITSQQYNFDRANIEVAYLRTITKDDVLDFYKDLIHKDAHQRHKLAVHVVSKAEGGAGTVPNGENTNEITFNKEPDKIENITKFKSTQSLFPLLQPYINLKFNSTKSKL